jgi:uncharacterized protein
MMAMTENNLRRAGITLNRRTFLAGALGTAMLPAIGLGAAAAPKPSDLMSEVRKYRKLDAHQHCGALGLDPAAVAQASDFFGIERYAVSIPLGDTPEAFRASNDIVLRLMREYPDRVLGQCFVNPRYPREALAEVNRCLAEGMIGLGELYHHAKINDPIYFPIVERCIEENASIMVHARADLGLLRPDYKTDAPITSSVAEDFVDVARRYPEAILIHGHIGGGGDWEYMCKALRDVPSVFIDTSGSVTDAGMIDFAVQQLGVERMLFATDINIETGVGKILDADLTEQQREAIFFDNFARILEKRGIHAN